MKKIFLILLILMLSVSVFGCRSEGNGDKINKTSQQSEEKDRQDVEGLVVDFGQKLQLVSLLAPSDEVRQSMQENYGELVSATLLAKWQSDPQNAPGRVTSSPWPDSIQVLSVERSSTDLYDVKGEILEMTSVEKTSGGVAAKRPITCTVKRFKKGWLIDAVTLGAYVQADSIVYENTQYGFNFTLPASWKGYTIVTDKWEGVSVAGAQSNKVVETGPIIKIRHPQWTSQNPRQDIPIMIFTFAQWNSLQNAEISVGAAPMAPSELGRNSKYVFALPARYNYAFPTGFEEVEQILKSNPLHPTADNSQAE